MWFGLSSLLNKKHVKIVNNIKVLDEDVSDITPKVGAATLSLHHKTGVPTLYKHGPGSVLLPKDYEPSKSPLQFMHTTDFIKFKPSTPMVITKKSFHDYEDNTEIPCEVVLMQDIHISDSNIRYVYYQYNFHNNNDDNRPLYQVIADAKNTHELNSALFEHTPKTKSIKGCHVMSFNQFDGVKHDRWISKIDSFQDANTKEHIIESSGQPDNWHNGKYFNPSKKLDSYKSGFLRVGNGMRKIEGHQIIDNRTKKDKESGFLPLTTDSNRDHSVIYCRQHDSYIYKGIFKGMFFQPLPPSESQDTNTVVMQPLTEDQCKNLDKFCKTSGGDVTIPVFQSKMESYRKENKMNPYRLTKMRVTNGDRKRDYAVSVVNDFDRMKEDPNCTVFARDSNGKPKMYSKTFEKPFYDNQVEGFVIMRVKAAYFVKILSSIMLTLICMALNNSVNRPSSAHFGKMDILGYRHSKRSNPTMNQAHQTLHRYCCYSTMNVSLLLFVVPFINLLGKQVNEMAQNSGMLLVCLTKRLIVEWNLKAAIIIQKNARMYLRRKKYIEDIEAIYEVRYNPTPELEEPERPTKRPQKDVLGYIGSCVSSWPRFTMASPLIRAWYIITRFFANTYHRDKDYLRKQYFVLLKKFYEESRKKGADCPHYHMRVYLEKFQRIYSRFWNKGRLPYMTTCCWTLMSTNEQWKLMNYFVLLDVDLAFDLSSDIFTDKVNQVTGSFYGALFGHLTSRSLYISNDGKRVTTIPPEPTYGLFAWGEYNNDKDLGSSDDDKD